VIAELKPEHVSENCHAHSLPYIVFVNFYDVIIYEVSNYQEGTKTPKTSIKIPQTSSVTRGVAIKI